jgi:hypothetical protein
VTTSHDPGLRPAGSVMAGGGMADSPVAHLRAALTSDPSPDPPPGPVDLDVNQLAGVISGTARDVHMSGPMQDEEVLDQKTPASS